MEIGGHDKWEYCLMTFSGYSGKKIIETLQKLGEEGWELTDVSIEENGHTKRILKRKLTMIHIPDNTPNIEKIINK